MPDKATGWAVVHFGKIDVSTVSATRRAAIVNHLIVNARTMVFNHTTDEEIEKLWWSVKGKDAEVILVKIAALCQSRNEAKHD